MSGTGLLYCRKVHRTFHPGHRVCDAPPGGHLPLSPRVQGGVTFGRWRGDAAKAPVLQTPLCSVIVDSLRCSFSALKASECAR